MIAPPSPKQLVLEYIADRTREIPSKEQNPAQARIMEEYGLTIPYTEILKYSWQRGSQLMLSLEFCHLIDNINIDNRFGKFEDNVVEPIKRRQGIYF